MMRLKKMKRVFALLDLAKCTGSIYCFPTGELALSLTGQPELWVHRGLTGLGFAVDPYSKDYIYRPRQNKRNRALQRALEMGGNPNGL